MNNNQTSKYILTESEKNKIIDRLITELGSDIQIPRHKEKIDSLKAADFVLQKKSGVSSYIVAPENENYFSDLTDEQFKEGVSKFNFTEEMFDSK